MNIPIAPAVKETRTYFRNLAKQEKLPLATIVEREYREIRQTPPMIQVAAKVKAGVAAESLRVDQWTVAEAQLLGDIATVILAVELGVAA